MAHLLNILNSQQYKRYCANDIFKFDRNSFCGIQTGSDNGLAPNKLQAIICEQRYQSFSTHIYPLYKSLGFGDLNHILKQWVKSFTIRQKRIYRMSTNPELMPQIIWTQHRCWLISFILLGTWFSEIWIRILWFSIKKKIMQLRLSSAKMAAILSRPQCVNTNLSCARVMAERLKRRPQQWVAKYVSEIMGTLGRSWHPSHKKSAHDWQRYCCQCTETSSHAHSKWHIEKIS